jgi:hypothetical protein
MATYTFQEMLASLKITDTPLEHTAQEGAAAC